MSELKKMPESWKLVTADGKVIKVGFLRGTGSVRAKIRALRAEFNRSIGFEAAEKLYNLTAGRSAEELVEMRNDVNSGLQEALAIASKLKKADVEEATDRFHLDVFRAIIDTSRLSEADCAVLEQDSFWMEQDLQEVEKIAAFFRSANNCY